MINIIRAYCRGYYKNQNQIRLIISWEIMAYHTGIIAYYPDMDEWIVALGCVDLSFGPFTNIRIITGKCGVTFAPFTH